MSEGSGPPFYEAIAVPTDPALAQKVPHLSAGFEWLKYFSEQHAVIETKPSRKIAVSLPLQGGAIALTPLPISNLPAGVYQVSWHLRITTPASVSSSVTLTISWTAGSIAQSTSGAALNGNTTTTTQSGTLPIRIDANTPISYSTAYASNGAGEMKYRLDLVITELVLDIA